MKKIAVFIVVLSLVTLSFGACNNQAPEPSADTASSVTEVSESSEEVEISEESESSEISVDSSSEEAVDAEEKTFEEMQVLFVMDGERTDERFVESSLTYTISGKTRDEIIEFMEKGVVAMGATEDTLLNNDALYNYTGTYGDDEGLVLHITEVSEGNFQIMVTY